MNSVSESRAALFTPFKIGRTELSNRIVMAPMTRCHSPGGVPRADVAEYYRRRAEGEVGLIITEGTVIDHPGSNGYPNVPHFYGEDALAGWEKVVEAVHRMGGKIAPQIWHVGPVRRPGMEPDPNVPGFGPSEIVEEGNVVVKEMTHDDIQAVVAAFADAAANAERLGFDAVEIHGAHGYLLDSFFWLGTNKRTDEYGGSISNRVRLGVEVVKAVRSRVSASFPVIYRFSQWKIADYSAKIAENESELREFIEPLNAAGVDVFHVSTRRFWVPAFDGSPETLSAMTKRITGKPVIAVGNFGLADEGSGNAHVSYLNEAIALFDRGDFDLIAAGRVLLAEPDWAQKVRTGGDSAIRVYTDEAMKTLVV